MLLVFVYFSVCSGTASKEERQRDKEKNDGGVLWVVRWEYAFRKIIIILAKVNTHDPQLPFFFFHFLVSPPVLSPKICTIHYVVTRPQLTSRWHAPFSGKRKPHWVKQTISFLNFSTFFLFAVFFSGKQCDLLRTALRTNTHKYKRGR